MLSENDNFQINYYRGDINYLAFQDNLIDFSAIDALYEDDYGEGEIEMTREIGRLLGGTRVGTGIEWPFAVAIGDKCGGTLIGKRYKI